MCIRDQRVLDLLQHGEHDHRHEGAWIRSDTACTVLCRVDGALDCALEFLWSQGCCQVITLLVGPMHHDKRPQFFCSRDPSLNICMSSDQPCQSHQHDRNIVQQGLLDSCINIAEPNRPSHSLSFQRSSQQAWLGSLHWVLSAVAFMLSWNQFILDIREGKCKVDA